MSYRITIIIFFTHCGSSAGDQGDIEVLKALGPCLRPGCVKVQGKVHKVTGQEVIESFLTEISGPEDLEEEVKKRIAKAVAWNVTLQGYIIKIKGARHYYTILDGNKNRFDNLMSAVDHIIKISCAYDLAYTYECSLVYTFLQRSLYGVLTAKDPVTPSLSAFLKGVPNLILLRAL